MLTPLTDVPPLPEGIVEEMTEDGRGISYTKGSDRNAPSKAWVQALVVELWQRDPQEGARWVVMGTFPDIDTARRAAHTYLAMGMYDD